MEIVPEDILKLLLAVLVGGLIGAEREFRDKSAGFRTIIFITLGAALFTILSLSIGVNNDPARIAANIVTGIGFLGAGAILREGGRVAGLTTAATIWLAASLGMGLGAGRYLLVGTATAIIMVVLWLFPAFEHWIDNIRETRDYEIVMPMDSPLVDQLPAFLRRRGVRPTTQVEHKIGNEIHLKICAVGRPRNHKILVTELMKLKDVRELHY